MRILNLNKFSQLVYKEMQEGRINKQIKGVKY